MPINFVQNDPHIGRDNVVGETVTINNQSSPADVQKAIADALRQFESLPGVPAQLKKDAVDALNEARTAAGAGPSTSNAGTQGKLEAVAKSLGGLTDLAKAGAGLATALFTIGRWIVGLP